MRGALQPASLRCRQRARRVNFQSGGGWGRGRGGEEGRGGHRPVNSGPWLTPRQTSRESTAARRLGHRPRSSTAATARSRTRSSDGARRRGSRARQQEACLHAQARSGEGGGEGGEGRGGGGRSGGEAAAGEEAQPIRGIWPPGLGWPALWRRSHAKLELLIEPNTVHPHITPRPFCVAPSGLILQPSPFISRQRTRPDDCATDAPGIVVYLDRSAARHVERTAKSF